MSSLLALMHAACSLRENGDDMMCSFITVQLWPMFGSSISNFHLMMWGRLCTYDSSMFSYIVTAMLLSSHTNEGWGVCTVLTIMGLSCYMVKFGLHFYFSRITAEARGGSRIFKSRICKTTKLYTCMHARSSHSRARSPLRPGSGPT